MYYDHSYFYTQISEEEYQKRVLDAKKMYVVIPFGMFLVYIKERLAH